MLFTGPTSFGQSHISKKNYTGDWELASSWSPVWDPPITSMNGIDITINGYITANRDITFSGTASKLIINDTLVIKGNLTLGDNNDLIINDKGILIIRGNLEIGNQTEITENGYLIIASNLDKLGSATQGSFSSNDITEKTFICGNVNTILVDNNPAYPGLNCNSQALNRYPGSQCVYGNYSDLCNDPVFLFYQSTCVAPQPSIIAGGPVIFCEGGSVVLTSGTGSSYLWSNGAKTASVTINQSGTYSVKITNSAGCLSIPSQEIKVTVKALPPTPIITATGATSFCPGGSVTLEASEGKSYIWSNGAATRGILVNTSGNYTVRVTDTTGCQSPVSAVSAVTVYNVAVPVISASGPVTFCSGENVNLSTTVGQSYLWSNGATTQSINTTTGGNFTVQVKDQNGCMSPQSLAINVTVNPLPLVNAGVDLTIPYGTNTSLNATVSGSGPIVYSWVPSTQLTNATIEDPNTTNLTATTNFILTATISSTSCKASDDLIVSVSGGPLSTAPVALPAILCAGTSVQLHSLAGGGSGSYTYSWSSSPTGFSSTEANPIVYPLITTTYNLLVNDGFNSATSSLTVTVNPLPVTPSITSSGALTFCSGNAVTLTSSAGNTYRWSSGQTSQSISVTESGTFTVQTISTAGCWSAVSSPVNVTVNPVPLRPVITSGGPASFCSGSSVTLSSSPEFSYLWSDGSTSQNISVTGTGSYTVQTTNSAGCSSLPSFPLNVTVYSLPSTPLITAGGPLTFCKGDAVVLTSSSAFINQWSNGKTTPSITVTDPGTYSLKTISNDGCLSLSSNSVTVNVYSLPATPVITVAGQLSFCSGGMVTLTSTPSANYLWSDNETSQSITVTRSDQYVVKVTDAKGCQSLASVPVKVTVNDKPFIGDFEDMELHFVFETELSASLAQDESGEWTIVTGRGRIEDPVSPVTKISGLVPGETIVRWTVRNAECEDFKDLKITVLDQLVPSVITPNNDGKNDSFRVSEYDGKISLTILNRWGSVEFSSDDYKNDWSGKNTKGNDLPADTYFYILRFDNGRVLKGSVLIKK